MTAAPDARAPSLDRAAQSARLSAPDARAPGVHEDHRIAPGARPPNTPAPGPDVVAAADGVTLVGRRWEPATAPWARMLIVHGIAEHSGFDDAPASTFRDAGIDVRAFDLRGFGLSGGRRAHVEGWDDYLEDLAIILASVPRDLPLVLLGHSMGGLIALTYATSGRALPDFLVLCSPSLGATIPRPLRAAGPILGRIAPTLMIRNPIRPEQLSRDPRVGEEYVRDPLLVPGTTARLGAEMFAAMARVPRSLAPLRIPTLVIHGAADTLVPAEASAPLGALPGVERRVYPGLRHETMLEPEGPAVRADVIAWIRRRVAGDTSATPRVTAEAEPAAR